METDEWDRGVEQPGHRPDPVCRPWLLRLHELADHDHVDRAGITSTALGRGLMTHETGTRRGFPNGSM